MPVNRPQDTSRRYIQHGQCRMKGIRYYDHSNAGFDRPRYWRQIITVKWLVFDRDPRRHEISYIDIQRKTEYGTSPVLILWHGFRCWLWFTSSLWWLETHSHRVEEEAAFIMGKCVRNHCDMEASVIRIGPYEAWRRFTVTLILIFKSKYVSLISWFLCKTHAPRHTDIT